MLYNFVYGLDINGFMSCHGLNSARTAAMKMVVKAAESKGTEIGATHEIPIVYSYDLVSLEGIVDGEAVSCEA